ncbi:MAG: TIM-barrel domain-containing protein [Niabella sp.]
MFKEKLLHAVFLIFIITGLSISASAQNITENVIITDVKTVNPTTISLSLNNGRYMIVDFYGENIFRLFEDSTGKILREPIAKPEAKILVDNPRRTVSPLKVINSETQLTVSSKFIQINFNKNNSTFSITDLRTQKNILKTLTPFMFEDNKAQINLQENTDEYFYGGGVQNGRFSHKGKTIAIENQNSWTDGGVASPTPFYWSTNGYGLMWYSFKKGKYDFGNKEKGAVTLYHETDYADVFFMIDNNPTALLNDFYQLTGNPILLPKFAFYEGHLNAYNRDYWKEDSSGILFEDGNKYRESQKDNGGIKESLNGELKNNYPFSARGVIDRYKNADMPLGWILPNDGYGAGYGQTSTLDSNILNLKNFGDYARKNGVEIGLWTQSDLHPKPGISALLQRDIIKEVRDAGVRVLKTDVAWVGAGYSFGLNGVADVAQITSKYGNDARPFIISLDGWAGTQRYASIWTGDQTGGLWEYIRFHIPTYIGSGLGGQPNITSDMDGIFGGKNTTVNVRDFQWKTFTPMQLNMDGWGANPKYPQALQEPATSINRNYLKLKSELLPYAYTIARQSVDGLPIIRAMFLEDSNPFTLGTATRYQYMFGSYFLVAPIYQATAADTIGNDIRHNIYLPKGKWIDYFTGEQYEGNRVINYFDAPLWKLPVFVKPGAIIPMVNANNNVHEIKKDLRIFECYPNGQSTFTVYDDDGTTEAYKNGTGVSTIIHSSVNSKNIASIIIGATSGSYKGFEPMQRTIFKVNISNTPKKITAKIGGKKIKLKKAISLSEFEKGSNVYYYDAHPSLNQFATKGSEFAKKQIYKNPQLLIHIAQTDITKKAVAVNISGYEFNISNNWKNKTGQINIPVNAIISEKNTAAFSLTPTWATNINADYYEILFNDVLYSHIKDTAFVFEDLQPETNYSFQLRAVNNSGASGWATINGTTKINPLQFAIKGIEATCTAPSQGGEGIKRLFDFDPDNNWHTKYGTAATPFEIIMDLVSVNSLEKLQYLPRSNGRNGIITKGQVWYSTNKKDWADAGTFNWKGNNDVKEFAFANQPTAKYIKISIAEGVGNFGSGRELYIFKVPGSSSYIPGDINNDGKIDQNDLTSYTNYTGLRKGDGDFEGYISNGDINKNNLIDAFDISQVATQLNGGVSTDTASPLQGKLTIVTNKINYKAGETINLIVKGDNLSGVNAFSFALPYDANKYEFLGVQQMQTGEMENLTYDRLHTNGTKVLYPTFVNIGNQPALNGSNNLFVIRLKAKQDGKFTLKIEDGILVDKDLNMLQF